MMKCKSKSFYILAPLLISCFILFGAKSINAQEVEDEREFDYSRNGERGPRHWGKIRREWGACNNGTLQSPIDLLHERVRIISKSDKRHYKIANATVRNRGHDIQVGWTGDAGFIYLNGREYSLRYAHWHSPSEHTIHSRRYDMELHMVHLNTEENVTRIAVVGALYKIGKADKFLTRLLPSLSSMINNSTEEVNLGMVDPNDIKIQSKRYYRYVGSLTIPPCTQGVIWTLNKKVRTVSREQVRLLREAVHDYAEENARPLQEVHNRDVYIYGPSNTN